MEDLLAKASAGDKESARLAHRLATDDGGSWEGNLNYMTVPKGSKGSGATIGIGLDLGQMNKDDLKRMNLPTDLASQLRPYLGKKGKSARDFIAKNPLTIDNPAYMSLLNKRAVSGTITKVKKRMLDAGNWDAMTEDEKFGAVAAQHQYGSKTQLPVQFGRGDFEAAHKNLSTWKDKTGRDEWEKGGKKGGYAGRNIENKYRSLAEKIKAGQVASQPQDILSTLVRG